MVLCSECGRLFPKTYRGICLECLWLKGTPVGVKFRVCACCGINKPEETFKGADRTCMLCRKLTTLHAVRYSHTIKFSQAVILHSVDGIAGCATCRRVLPLAAFPMNSFECFGCWFRRCLVEVIRITERYDDFTVCSGCGTQLLYSSMPFGSLVCRSCINKKNSKGKQA